MSDLQWHIERSKAHAEISKQRIEELLRIRGNARTFLDIGCGIGTAVRVGEELGLECMGIEPNRFACEFLRTHTDLKIKQGLFDSKSFDCQFDLVMLDNVLEHIRTPRKFMDDVFSVVKPKGLLYLIVPGNKGGALRVILSILFRNHSKSIFRGNDAHINHFFRKSIMRLSADNNAQCVKTERRGAYIFQKP